MTNEATVYIRVHVSRGPEHSFLSGKYSGEELLGRKLDAGQLE